MCNMPPFLSGWNLPVHAVPMPSPFIDAVARVSGLVLVAGDLAMNAARGTAALKSCGPSARSGVSNDKLDKKLKVISAMEDH